ncbi:MAG: hypothetical protein M0D55_18085 [Elusimicrobiota bacterium]|nr:MAG: hypothetical protein M0D55_18085 [Elusimicrobiota bacterium]
MDFFAIIVGHGLMLYACASLAAAWAWGSRKGSSELWMTVLGLAVPVAAWLMSIAKPAVLWAAPASIALLALMTAKPRAEVVEAIRRDRSADRAAAEDRAISHPDDGAARMTLAKIAEDEGRWDDALDHYDAAHRLSDRMLPEAELASARERVDASRAAAARPKGLTAHPVDAAFLAAAALLALRSPVRGLAPLSCLLFVLWLRGDLGGE